MTWPGSCNVPPCGGSVVVVVYAEHPFGMSCAPGVDAKTAPDSAEKSAPVKTSKFAFSSTQTTTVVRRKVVAPKPAPSPGRDIWPGPHPARQNPPSLGNLNDGNTATSAPLQSEDHWEFFCDKCNYTVENDETRYECILCPSEYLLCSVCYPKLGKEHEHVLLENTGGAHKTMAG
mmetsp:Transcript_34706/g.44266  ORF Transcript_34706/g.44266 Transcript_34706/m.44266 type:complete len:175 (+) Transcript_34706:572-1096(+)